MTITIVHRGVELTAAIEAYVHKKMAALAKYADVTQLDVEVGLVTPRQQKGKIFECRACVPYHGKTICVERQAETLYKAIDKVKDHLRVELVDEKRKRENRHLGKVNEAAL